MSKGNMLLGYATGSVGDVTFARVKGQQTQRARNRNPNNPKTPAQMAQRAKLASAVNFFKATSARLFKFAYEDRGSHESDYNAFMRHNMSRTMAMPKKYNNNGYLPVTPFNLSQGSLQPLKYVPAQHGMEIAALELDYELKASDIANSTTIGKLTELLKGIHPHLQNGDILTAISVGIESDTTLGKGFPGYPVDEDLGEYDVLIEQVILKDGDGEIVPSFFQLKRSGIQAGDPMSFAPTVNAGYLACATAVIISRQTAGGVLVSTTDLTLSQELSELYDTWFVSPADDSYKNYIPSSWDASLPAILQGGL